MANVSELFQLGATQAELDFVDIDPSRDTPLFLDPYAISIKEDEWSVLCTEHILSFFQSAIDAIRDDRDSRAVQLLRNLSEPNETCLGVSSGRPAGRGVSGKQAFDLYEALRDSTAAQTGVLSDLGEAELFVAGIGRDKVSDITTNVIKKNLISYTQDQSALHGIPVTQGVAMSKIWSLGTENWISEYVDLPVVDNRPLIFVPKYSVRRTLALDSQEFYNFHILSFLQAEHLNADSALVTVLRSGARRVYKSTLKDAYPFSKDLIGRFVADNPSVLENYKRIKGAEGALSNHELDESFDEPTYAEALSCSLSEIPLGAEGAVQFEKLALGLLEFIFYPNLFYPRAQHPIDEGRKRIDIIFTNSAQSGFFYRAHTAHRISSNLVMVECKNYNNDVANEEIDQLCGRFSTNRGRLGILMARNFENRPRFIQRCRDAARSQGNIVIPLVDSDIHQLLVSIKERSRSRIDEYIESIFNEVIS